MTLQPPRCTATCSGRRRPDRAGQPCRNPAVRGATVCAKHGGAARQVRARAAVRLADAEVRALLAEYTPEPVENPLEALKEIAGRILAWSKIAEQRVAELDSLETFSEATGEQVRAAVVVFERALDAARRVLVDMARLKIDERIVAVNERVAAAFVDVFREVMNHPDLALTEEQRRTMPGVVRDILRAQREITR
ncbi:hypothetical protein [Frankia sp. CiP1_Cm_nod2]|uniref:hypothetical protein n=1 Tax=Frankia sp. CiP1_Cm_nod2 TaxID=2897161 RepID=UPI002024B204